MDQLLSPDAKVEQPASPVNELTELIRKTSAAEKLTRIQARELHTGYDKWIRGLDVNSMRDAAQMRKKYNDGSVWTIRSANFVDSGGFTRDVAIGFLTPEGEDFDASQWDRVIIQPLLEDGKPVRGEFYKVRYDLPTVMEYGQGPHKWSQTYESETTNAGGKKLDGIQTVETTDLYDDGEPVGAQAVVDLKSHPEYDSHNPAPEVSLPKQDVLTKARIELTALQGSKIVGSPIPVEAVPAPAVTPEAPTV
jgi:hypothetical protein